MTALASVLEDYLALRRAVGFSVEHLGTQLPKFVVFHEEEGAESITIDLALRWGWPTGRGAHKGSERSVSSPATSRRSTRHRGPATRPAAATVSPPRPTPFLTDDEVQTIMAACRSLEPSIRAMTLETVLGLLWTTGMRVGETLRLRRGDLRLEDGLLVVQRSKGNKSRLVPLAPSTVEALAAYERHRPATAESFFVSGRGRPLRYSALHVPFKQVLERTGVAWHPPPRLGDFRHGFAVRTILRWYRTGEDVQAMLPRLSTYLGHVEPSSTYWYLEAAPELMAIAAERLEVAE